MTSDSGLVTTPYGPLPARYQCAKLAEVCVGDGGVQTGPFGSQLHKADYAAVGSPIITVEHLGENRILHRDLPLVSDEDRQRLSWYSLRSGDIVFSRVGSVDLRALVRKEEDGWLFSGRCLRVCPEPDVVDSEYLSWFFGLPGFRDYVRRIAFGATMPSLNTQLLGELPIYFPPLPEQRAIAHILGWLADCVVKRRLLAVAYVLQSAGILIFATTDSPWQAVLFLVVFSAGWGGAIPVLPALEVEYFGLRAFGGIGGLLSAIATLGAFVGPVFAGVVSDVVDSYRPAFLLMTFTTMAAVPAILMMGRVPAWAKEATSASMA